MHYVSAVAVVDGGEHLLDDVGSVLLAEILLVRDALEKLSSIAKSTQKEKVQECLMIVVRE